MKLASQAGAPVRLVVPASVTVATNTNTLAFEVVPDGVDKPQTGTLTATVGTVVKTATLSVSPAVLNTFTLSSTSVKGGTKITGLLSLTGWAGLSGVPVKLKSDQAAISVPSLLTVPFNNSALRFAISTKPVLKTTVVHLTAGSKTVTVTLTP